MADLEILDSAETERAESYARLYLLLARVFAKELDAGTLRELRTPPLAEALNEAGIALDAEFRHGDLQHLEEQLAVEYAWLFLGPGRHIPPLESIQRPAGSGQLNGPESAQVRRFIEQSGFDIAPAFNGFYDHLSVALEFLGQLVALEADARQRQRSMALQQLFIEQHLGRWLPAFCEKVAKHAHLSFYREMAALVAALIASESERLSESAQALQETSSSTVR